MNKTEVKVYLRIHDFPFEPDKLTEEIGIQPTNSWKKGDLIPNRKIPLYRKQSTWELESGKSYDESPNKIVSDILEKIKLGERKIIELVNRYTGELSVVIYTHESNYGIFFDKELIKKISELGLEIDIDIYSLS